jgi:ferredoxin
MQVSIDQEQCTSSGLCEVIAPDVFVIASDALAHLVDEDQIGKGGAAATFCMVLPGHEDVVREAAEQCPGECIYIRE